MVFKTLFGIAAVVLYRGQPSGGVIAVGHLVAVRSRHRCDAHQRGIGIGRDQTIAADGGTHVPEGRGDDTGRTAVQVVQIGTAYQVADTRIVQSLDDSHRYGVIVARMSNKNRKESLS